MAYEDFKDLATRRASDKLLHVKQVSIAKNPRNDRYQRGRSSMVYNFLDKIFASLADKSASNGPVKNENISTKVLPVQSITPIVQNLRKIKVHSFLQDNICGADLPDMQLIRKFNKGFRFLLCLLDTCSKYGWVIPLKGKIVIIITNTFEKLLKESNCKPNRIWVDTDSEFYNRSMKSWLEKIYMNIFNT